MSTSPPAPRPGARLHPDERRAQILAAARRVLESDPHRDPGVDLVAAEAGVSPALVFHYFGSAQKFRYAVIEAAATELTRRTTPDLGLPPDQRLRAGIQAFVRAVLEAPQLYRATLLSSAAGDPELRELHARMRAVFDRRVIEALAELGLPTSPRLVLVCQGWQGYVEQTVLSWIEQPTVDAAELEDLCAGSLTALLGTV